MTKQELTHPQERVLAFIWDYVEENGYPPTVRQIAEEIGVSSTSTAHFHLQALQRKGYIEIATGSPRAIKLHRTVGG